MKHGELMSGLVIDHVLHDSIAAELDLLPGDRLLRINGHPVRDIIDYNYLSSDETLTLEVGKLSGEIWEIELERDADDRLGIIFSPPQPAECGNKCIFCFVHQLPRGLRTPLYVKDEDYRLSFLYGNYVTLANIHDDDLTRISEQRLSPLYISVHTTDPLLRETMLGKKGLQPILDVLKKLAAARISMHTQVVLCPGLNDGDQLAQTITDLAGLHPWVASLAIVPLGLTSHRSKLPRLHPVTREIAAEVIASCEFRNRTLREELGEPFLYLADEFYLKADLPFPPLESYGDLPQLENGVGMIPLFLDEAADVLKRAAPLPHQTITVVTGCSPYSYLADFLEKLGARTGVSFRPYAIKNRLFGESVTVTGLVPGQDIIAGLAGRELGDLVFVPDVMLKEGEEIFLDELSLDALADALGVEVVVVSSTPAGIYAAIPR
jgi:putative radical SAM enzyme (TIGR03279 family)